MIEIQNIILKIYVINFPIFKLSILLNISSYVCIKNWIKFFSNQIGLCFILELKINLVYLLSFAFIRCTTSCHSLSLLVICFYLLSFVVTRCHWLPLVVPLVVIRCHSLCHSMSFVVTRCHSMYHSFVFL